MTELPEEYCQPLINCRGKLEVLKSLCLDYFGSFRRSSILISSDFDDSDLGSRW